MSAADGFIGARAVAILLVHFYSHSATSWDAALGGCRSVVGIAADIVACYGGDGTVAVGQSSACGLV